MSTHKKRSFWGVMQRIRSLQKMNARIEEKAEIATPTRRAELAGRMMANLDEIEVLRQQLRERA